MSLDKRVAVITGASGALGQAITKSLAQQRLGLALLDRNTERLAALRSDLALPESRILTLPIDLSNPSIVSDSAKAVVAKFGRVDILIHLVGGWIGGKTLLESSAYDLISMLDQHMWTSFHVAQAFVPHLVRNGWGRIVMISSPFAANPVAKGGPYAIGKSAQEALLLCLSQELKGTGVTANLLIVKTIDAQREKVSTPSAENASWATPEEITNSILQLLAEDTAGINGAKIPLYGPG
jgi:NAD(P)-dependent dehydrogenase (short-subunit alcohol dehydrogenase family)